MGIDEDGKRRHEFDLMDRRLGEQRIIDELKDHIETSVIKKRIEPLEDKVTSLESTRTYAKGFIKATSIGVPAIGSIAWFFWKFGKYFEIK